METTNGNGNGATNGGAEKKSLLERTIAYAITFRAIGNSRKVPTALIETDAERELLRVSKRILECDEFQAIRRMDSNLKAYIAARSVAYPLKAGIHLVPVDLVEEVDAEVERVRPLRVEAVKAFAGRVDELKVKDEAALGSLFNPADYPTADDVVAAYDLETRYMALDTPGRLSGISKAMFDREKSRIQVELQNAADAVRQVQRAQMQELVDGLLDILRPTESGRRRAIKGGGTVDKLREFMDRYGKLNVADDAELAGVVEKARAIFAGQDCESLRSSDDARAAVAAGMETVKADLAALVVDGPVRKFRAAV